MAFDLRRYPEDTILADRLGPAIAWINETALARERERGLAFEAVAKLQEAGFGALRVPEALGGDGLSLRQLFRLMVVLAEADSNLPQILRAHFAFVEGRLTADGGDEWLERVASGALFGAAMAERTPGTETTTILTRHPEGGWMLDGEKYYSTGTIYASWIIAVAKDGNDRLMLAVPADLPGITILDDWDGFGQRLTGSGTTRFEAVRLSDENILRRHPAELPPGDGYLTAFYQLFHLAALAGIAHAVLRDATLFVRGKTRTFGVAGITTPREDPLVQRVIGRLAAIAFTADSLVDRIAGNLDHLHERKRAKVVDHAEYVAGDIAAFQAQQTMIDLVLEATAQLFEVGGASATSSRLQLDRHWRNARTLASHNPAIQRERAIGDYVLNGTDPASTWTGGLRTPKTETA